MAIEFNTNAVKASLVAAGTITQYNFVKLDSNGKIVACSGATDQPIGIAQNSATTGQAVETVISGGSKVVAGGTVASGARVGTGASATCVAYVPGTATTNYIVGTAIAGGASGEVITVVINCAAAGRGA